MTIEEIDKRLKELNYIHSTIKSAINNENRFKELYKLLKEELVNAKGFYKSNLKEVDEKADSYIMAKTRKKERYEDFRKMFQNDVLTEIDRVESLKEGSDEPPK